MRLKIEIFPADDGVNVAALLDELEAVGYVQRYGKNNTQYIQIVNFKKHQTPHVKEQASTIPAPDKPLPRQLPAPPDSHDSHDCSPTGEGAASAPPAPEKRKPKRQRARSRLPQDLELPADWREYAAVRRPDLDPVWVFENFSDYHLAKGSLMADWKRAWQRWVRNERHAKSTGNTATPQSRHREALARRGRPGNDAAVGADA